MNKSLRSNDGGLPSLTILSILSGNIEAKVDPRIVPYEKPQYFNFSCPAFVIISSMSRAVEAVLTNSPDPTSTIVSNFDLPLTPICTAHC